MRIHWIVPLMLVLGLLLPIQAQTLDTLTPVSRVRIFPLLPIDLQSQDLRVLDVATADSDLYFLIGDAFGRPASPNVILRLREDGTHSLVTLPGGGARSLSVDAARNVHALLLPQSRDSEPRMVRCDASLGNCSTTAFPDEGRHIWARHSARGHVVELSVSGALYLDGVQVMTPAVPANRAEPSRLLSAPSGCCVMRLNQVSGALTVIDPSRPSGHVSAVIQGEQFQAALAANRNAWDAMPRNSNSSGMAIYAAAASASGDIFLALSPYNVYTGATIVQVSEDGATKRALRCGLPENDTGKDVIVPGHIGVSGSRLVLVSLTGDLLTYKL